MGYNALGQNTKGREQIWFRWMILELSGTQGYGDNRSGAEEQCLNTWENLLIFLKSHIIVNTCFLATALVSLRQRQK